MIQKLRKATMHPIDACHLLLALSEGVVLDASLHWFSRRIRIGKGFKVVGKFMPHGPGAISGR